MTGDARVRDRDAGLEAVGGLARLVPAQARPVDLVYRSLGSVSESDGQRDTAAAAARTAVACEIERRRPGEPYVLHRGRAADYPGLAPQLQDEEPLVFGVVYRFVR